MKCNKCGTENYDDALFCGYCGAKMVVEPTPTPAPQPQPQPQPQPNPNPKPKSKPDQSAFARFMSLPLAKKINNLLYGALTLWILFAMTGEAKVIGKGGWWFWLIVIIVLIFFSNKQVNKTNGKK